MAKNSRDFISELTTARQTLVDAEARVSELEAALYSSENTPIQPSFYKPFLKRFDLRVSVGYGIVATLWVLFSDRLFAILVSADVSAKRTFSLFTGLIFVWITALGLFILLHSESRKRNQIAEQQAKHKQVTAALLETETRYHRTFDDLLESAEIIGFDWRYLYVNDAAAKFGRAAKKVLLGSTVLEVYPGFENSEMYTYLRTCMEQRVPLHFENEFTFPDGTKTWFDSSVQPIPEGIFVLSLDITKRKQSEIALQNYAKRMEILHKIDAGIINATSTQEIVETALKHIRQLIPCQRASVVLFDRDIGEALVFANDSNLPQSLNKIQRTLLLPGLEEGFEGKTTRIIEDLRLVHPQMPAYKPLIEAGMVSGIQALLMFQGRAIGLLALSGDTPGSFTAEHEEIATEIASQIAIAIRQMHLSAEIRQNEAQYRLLAENMADVVWMLDIGTSRFTYVSPSVQQLRGYTPEEVLTQTLADTLTPDSLQMMVDSLPERIEAYVADDSQAVSQTYEVELTCKDGSTVWTEVLTTFLADSNGEMRLLGVTRDITSRRQAEAELRESEE